MLLPHFTISVASTIVSSSLMCFIMLSVNVSATSVEKFTKFTRQTDFNQAECPAGDEVFSKTAKRLTQCLIHCYNENSCRTVLYDDPKCNGCTNTYMVTPSITVFTVGVTHFQKTAECEDGWILLNWSCYRTSNQGTFDDGKTWCGLQGAHVVSFETEEENNAIKENTQLLDTASTMGFFIGFNDCETNFEWRDYTTGDLATFLDFLPPEPTDTDGECCVIMFLPWNYKWADIPCSRIYRTLCEKPAN